MGAAAAGLSLQTARIFPRGESHMKHVIPPLVGALTLYTMSPSGLAAPAHDDAVRQEIVRFGDLDLTRPADAQELFRRIKHAAHHVCEAIGFGDPTIAMSDRICIDQ